MCVCVWGGGGIGCQVYARWGRCVCVCGGGGGVNSSQGKRQKGGRARREGGGWGSVEENATLTTPDHLRAKKGDQMFTFDPLFHTMSALFDEGGAKGKAGRGCGACVFVLSALV